MADDDRRQQVRDWSTDFDHLDPAWAADPHAIWNDLRQRCPVAHTDRYAGVYLPTRYDDIQAIAYDTEHFSSRQLDVRSTDSHEFYPIPPLTSDPPAHRLHRMPLIRPLTPVAVARLRDTTAHVSRDLLGSLAGRTECDAVRDYARPLALDALCRLLGIDGEDAPAIARWVSAVMVDAEATDATRALALDEMDRFFASHLRLRILQPGDDLASYLLSIRTEGRPIPTTHVRNTLRTLALAGFQTSTSTIAFAIHHLALHPDLADRLRRDPGLMPAAVDEFLRLSSPVMVARRVLKQTGVRGCPLSPNHMVLLPFAAANRDPEVFDRPDEVVLDRPNAKSHLAFGAGIHKCVGQHLARMVLEVGIEAWIQTFPCCRVSDRDRLRWFDGTFRGFECLRVSLGGASSRRAEATQIPSKAGQARAPKTDRGTIFGEYVVDLGGLTARMFVRISNPSQPRGTLVCLHGYPDNGSDFDGLSEAASAAGYRVICPDWPGRGRSDWLPAALYTPKTYFKCLSACMTSVVGEAHFIGSSFSGSMVLSFLAASRTRFGKLILNDPVLVSCPAYDEILELIVTDSQKRFKDGDDMVQWLRQSRASVHLLSEAEMQAYAHHRAIHVDGQLRFAYDPELRHPIMRAIGHRFSYAPLLSRVRGKIMLTYGLESQFKDRMHLAQIAKDVPSITIFDDFAGGHPPMLRDAHQIATILDFLDS